MRTMHSTSLIILKAVLCIPLFLFPGCGPNQMTNPSDHDDLTQSMTKPTGGAEAKPVGFVIHLPWKTGKTHRITQGYTSGAHKNGNRTFGFNDLYALDFNMNTLGGEIDEVYPVASGTVLYAGEALGRCSTDGEVGYGDFVVINHKVGDTDFQSLYAHLSAIYVTIGAAVTPWKPIGAAGKTGTGAEHLHFALYKGARIVRCSSEEDTGFSFSADDINACITSKGKFPCSEKKCPQGPACPVGGVAIVPEPFSNCLKEKTESCTHLGDADDSDDLVRLGGCTGGVQVGGTICMQPGDSVEYVCQPGSTPQNSIWKKRHCIESKCYGNTCTDDPCHNVYSTCTGCILSMRNDILPFYQKNGWNISCIHWDDIVANWCNIDGPGCRDIVRKSCSDVCETTSCGSACTDCILDNRADILPFYQANGWDTSCFNHDNIIANWCGIDPSGCKNVQDTLCKNHCH